MWALSIILSYSFKCIYMFSHTCMRFVCAKDNISCLCETVSWWSLHKYRKKKPTTALLITLYTFGMTYCEMDWWVPSLCARLHCLIALFNKDTPIHWRHLFFQNDISFTEPTWKYPPYSCTKLTGTWLRQMVAKRHHLAESGYTGPASDESVTHRDTLQELAIK